MKKIHIIFAVPLLFALGSCNKNFEEINTNPNGLSKVTPANLLAPALKKSVEYGMSRSQRVNNELMQVTINMGDGDGKIFRYEIRSSEADYLYNNLFLQLYNFKDIYDLAEKADNKSYMGVSLICQAWLFSILTDTYGDIPYSNALQGKQLNISPEFDSQESIYKGLFQSLDSANVYLKGAANLDNGSDPVYGGNVSLWRKFGNSLYLRLLMRVSEKATMNAPAQIRKMIDEKAADYPVIANNKESAVLRWTGTAPYTSPFSTWRPGDWYAPKLSSFFVDNLNEWSDPRIQKWASLYDGEYAGIASGYPIGTNPVGKSALLTSLMTEPLLGNILNYSEIQFVLAEAAVKGWIGTKTAKQYYEEGTKNAIEMWSLEMPKDYLNGQHIVWNESASQSRKMQLIHQQKYYSLFFTDMQSWFEFRRTGYPELPILSGHLNNGVMPARLNYPVYIQSANPINYKAAVQNQGPDNINTLVWWQKP